MRVLAGLLPPDALPGLDAEHQNRLTEYATVTRYPGDYEPVSVVEARQAVKAARQVRRDVRRLLPPKALRQKK